MIQAGLSDLRQSFDVGVKVLRPLQKLFRLYPQTITLGIRDSNKQAAYVEAVDELAHHSTVPAFVNALKWKCKAFNAINMEVGIGFGREYCFIAASGLRYYCGQRFARAGSMGCVAEIPDGAF